MDKHVRALEKKVLAGDLSVVIQLAAAYQRSGQAPPLPVDIIYEALRRASRELGVIANYSEDVEYWNSGGDGYKALMLTDLAVRISEGKNVTIEEYTDVINSKPELVIQECANCGSVEDEDMVGDLCEWCQADEQGSPYGRCPDCRGHERRTVAVPVGQGDVDDLANHGR